jgi:hypothetical protein
MTMVRDGADRFSDEFPMNGRDQAVGSSFTLRLRLARARSIDHDETGDAKIVSSLCCLFNPGNGGQRAELRLASLGTASGDAVGWLGSKALWLARDNKRNEMNTNGH